MATKLELLVEAEKRGLLPPEKIAMLDEARKRGLISAAPATPAAAPVAPAAPAAAPVAPAAAPEGPRNYDLSEVPGAAAENFGKSGGQFFSGVAHLLNPMNLPSNVAAIATPAYGAIAKFSPQAYILRQLFDTPEVVQGAIDAANAMGGHFKARFGGYENIKRTVAEDPVGALADLSVVLGGTGMGLKAAGLSRAAKAVNALSTGTNPLTVPLKATALAGKGAAATGRVVTNALRPKTNFYRQIIEDRGPQILNALNDPNPVIVPGVAPIAAEVAAKTGATQFAAVGNEAKRIASTPYQDLATTSNAAVLEHIRPSSMPSVDALKTARTTAAAPHYAASDVAVVQITPALDEIMSRPAMRAATGGTTTSVANRGNSFMTPGTPGTPPSYNPFSNTTVPGTPGIPATMTGAEVHRLKITLDDMIKYPEKFGVTQMKSSDIRALRNDFIAEIGKQNPEYLLARDAFRAGSPPVNQAEVLGRLREKTAPLKGEETGALRSTQFTGLVNNEKSLLRQSLSTGLMTKLEDALTPQQMKALDDVAREFARQETATRLGNAGAATAPKLGDVGTTALAPAHFPGILERMVMAYNSIMNRVAGRINAKMGREIALEMMKPQLAAAGVSKALAQEALIKKVSGVAGAIGDTTTGAVRTGALGQATNALAPDQKSRNAYAE